MAKATAAPTGEREWWQTEYERECAARPVPANADLAAAGFKRTWSPRYAADVTVREAAKAAEGRGLTAE